MDLGTGGRMGGGGMAREDGREGVSRREKDGSTGREGVGEKDGG